MFSNEAFQLHVCDYDEEHNLITPPINNNTSSITTLSKSIKEEPQLPPEPPCIRLLRENQIRIRRFLKDELKYDINTSNNLGTSANGNTMSTNSVVASSSTSSSISTSNSSKKQEGPHECTLCERKFVHASGLLRHMEKHALDLIPSNNSASSNKSALMQGGVQSINCLRVVIKCTLCGRIFFEPNGALKHIYSHFPDALADQKELDNCSEIPYESYVDDALNNLKLEVSN